MGLSSTASAKALRRWWTWGETEELQTRIRIRERRADSWSRSNVGSAGSDRRKKSVTITRRASGWDRKPSTQARASRVVVETKIKTLQSISSSALRNSEMSSQYSSTRKIQHKDLSGVS